MQKELNSLLEAIKIVSDLKDAPVYLKGTVNSRKAHSSFQHYIKDNSDLSTILAKYIDKWSTPDTKLSQISLELSFIDEPKQKTA